MKRLTAGADWADVCNFRFGPKLDITVGPQIT
jgi:hypothetical protein